MTVECAFGMLTQLFRIFANPIRLGQKYSDLSVVNETVYAAVRIHNFLISHRLDEQHNWSNTEVLRWAAENHNVQHANPVGAGGVVKDKGAAVLLNDNDVITLPVAVRALAREQFDLGIRVTDAARWSQAADDLGLADEPFQYLYRFIKQAYLTNTFDVRIYLAKYIDKHAPDMPRSNADRYAARAADRGVFQLLANS